MDRRNETDYNTNLASKVHSIQLLSGKKYLEMIHLNEISFVQKEFLSRDVKINLPKGYEGMQPTGQANSTLCELFLKSLAMPPVLSRLYCQWYRVTSFHGRRTPSFSTAPGCSCNLFPCSGERV